MEILKNKQRQKKVDLIKKYQNKLNFSIISLIFFLIMTAYTFFVPLLGVIAPIVFGLTSLVFIQQTIRSYNYKKFHTNNYNFMESVYEGVEDVIKSK